MTAETATDAAASVNGSGPAPSAPAADAPCENCVTGGEKGMAILAGLFGLFVLAMAFDIFSGGRVSGWVRERSAPGE